MKIKYLFPNRFKQLGWLVFAPAVVLGVIALILELEPAFLNLKVPALYVDQLFGDQKFFTLIENNFLNELLGVLIIVGGILVAFSKEKVEDEYIARIRLESLVWSVYVNYAILLLAILFIYDLGFMWVMIFNMFTILMFFIIRFNWQLARLKKTSDYEE
jgi:hypothetical protein